MTDFAAGEKVRTLLNGSGTVVLAEPDVKGRLVVDVDGEYQRLTADFLTRAHPTRFVVEYREPRALEYIVPQYPRWENGAGLFFVHEGGEYGAPFFKGKKRFCVVETLEDGDTYDRPAPETVRTIERRVPRQGELFISRFLASGGVPQILRASVVRPDDEVGRKDVIVEVPVSRPVQYLIERRPPVGMEQGIRFGCLLRNAGDWAVTRVIL
jgi:hypothetical protein